MGYEDEIRVLRDRINEIDAQLVPLFEARMRAADEVAAVKQKYGMPVYDAAREAAVIEKALRLLQDASYADSLRKFYQSLMSISRHRQRTRISFPPSVKKIDGAVGYLGLPGSFSYIAAHEAYLGAQLMSLPSFKAIFEALKDGRIALAMLPVENTETGSITAVIDLLARYGYFHRRGTLLKVTHSLLPPPEPRWIPSPKSTRIRSRSASAAVSRPSAHCGFPALSTAQAAQDVAPPERSPQAASRPKKRRQSMPYRFGDRHPEQRRQQHAVVAVCHAARRPRRMRQDEHRVHGGTPPCSLLAEVLQVFKEGGVNIHKLESRPLKDRLFEYLFHLDFEAVSDPHVAAAGQGARQIRRLTWLGSYPRMAQ